MAQKFGIDYLLLGEVGNFKICICNTGSDTWLGTIKKQLFAEKSCLASLRAGMKSTRLQMQAITRELQANEKNNKVTRRCTDLSGGRVKLKEPQRRVVSARLRGQG